MEDDLLILAKAGFYGLLALVGGLISYLCNSTSFTLRLFLAKGLGSGFAGFLMGLLCVYFDIPNSLAFCISGTFGYLGAEVTIAFLRKVLMNKLNIHIE